MEGKTIIDWLVEKCPCGKRKYPEQRTVVINRKPPPGEDAYVPETFPSNEVTSSKYTAWNFIFKNLFEQFHRIANLYFLIVAIVSGVIDSPVSPITSALPLILVVIVTAVKQGYEDWLRHKSDKEVNNRPAIIVRDGKTETLKAKDIQVGDIVKVPVNHGIPCDMVLLSSEDPEGTCYITTANLDGETNLKTYRCISDTKTLQTDLALETLHASIKCEQPNTELYRFVGNLLLYQDTGKVEERSLSAENVVLRGSRLKNTTFIYGCAIFTGQDTKISMNSKVTSLKFSRIERRMNTFLLIFMAMLVAYSVIWTGLKYWYNGLAVNSPDVVWYFDAQEPATARHVVENFLAFMLLINYVIPISLYVTIELQKIAGSKFFEWDVEMFDAQSNEPAKANTSDLNEELGQVEYLFTDKTGTMTENKMEFRQCSVAGQRYVELGGMLCEQPDIPGVQPSPVPVLTPAMEAMLTVLVLCHTVAVDRKDASAGGVGTKGGAYSHNGFSYEYEASSPDEKALVEACRRYGVVFHGVRNDWLEVTFKGVKRLYTISHRLEFDATRKMMSVILKGEDGSMYLMCKGAETAIFDRLVEGDVQTANKHLEEFAKLGLRTLVIAQRKLTLEEYETYNNLLYKARTALTDREENLSMAYSAIEKGLTLLGITAVEDKLQDGVPETFTALREAGIQIWVVTGDKEETAVNISYAAGHFSPDMTELKLTKVTDDYKCGEILREYVTMLKDDHSRGDHKRCLVVDGQSLAIALSHHRDLLQAVCMSVVTVLACRMSPLQKAEVVSLMKHSPGNPCTAAIGDGANDVSMIKEAHLGIGIMGKEGRQAVRASDYAFGKFRFLRRALLVHGHYYYVRLAVLVQYFFYKNLAMILSQLYFTFYSGYSAQSFFDSIFLTFFNITMTSLPILLFGLFEQHVAQKRLYDHPKLYKTIQKNKRLSYLEFFKWCIIGIWHSLVFFFGTYFAIHDGNSPDSEGHMYGVYDVGAIVFTACVFTVNIKLMLESYLYNWLIFFGFGLTLVGFYGLVLMVSEIWWPFFFDNTFYKSFLKIFSSPFSWLLLLLLIVAALLIDILLRAITDNFSELYHRSRTSRVDPAVLTRYQSTVEPVAPTFYITPPDVNGAPPTSNDIKRTQANNDKNLYLKSRPTSASSTSSQLDIIHHMEAEYVESPF